VDVWRDGAVLIALQKPELWIPRAGTNDVDPFFWICASTDSLWLMEAADSFLQRLISQVECSARACARFPENSRGD
jgi:hypothetical protein